MTMTTTENNMTLTGAIGKVLAEGNGDFLKEAIKAALTELMAVEVGRMIGAERHERTDARQNQRNGYRERPFDTRVGTIDLAVPKLRQGSYFPSFLEPRRRAEEALLSVVQEAYVNGVSTRKVEKLVQSLGVANLSKSEVSRICASLSEQVELFRNRPLERQYPYLWLDATHLKVRENGSVVSCAVLVAYGLNDDGYREVLGVSTGVSESEESWLGFLRELLGRGLKGVRLVISDAHQGLKNAIAQTLAGASWQRCCVHFMRNVHGKVSKAQQGVVTAAVRTIFAQPDATAAKEQLRRVADTLEAKHPQVAKMLEEAEADILAYMAFPEAHWRQIRSTNLLERLNREIARRADVVGIFPNRDAVVRLIGMVLAEQHDEWQIGRRYLGLETLAALKPPAEVLQLPQKAQVEGDAA
jgi:transposase-like protein